MDSENSECFRTLKFPRIRTSRSGPEAAQPSEAAISEGDGIQRVETLRLTTVERNHHAPLPEEVRDVDL